MSPIDQDEPLRIGAEVLGRDGSCGQLVRVIVDPLKQAVTHLAVAPRHDPALGRLVPIEMVESADGDRIHISATADQFQALDDADDVQFLPTNTDLHGYGSHAVNWPYYGIETPLGGIHHQPFLTERVPLGEVDVRRGDQVHATDGWIGSVHGLVIDPGDHHVTHVLLQEGHLWGRKQVAIPIGAASRVGNEIQVTLSKQQVEDLPELELKTP